MVATVRPENYSLFHMARIIRTHPRTLLRRITGEANPAYGPYVNPMLDAREVAEKLGIKNVVGFKECLSGNDTLLKKGEAAEILDLSVRTFDRNRYVPMISLHKILRFNRKSLLAEHAYRFL